MIKQIIQGYGKNITKYCNKCNSNRFDLILDYLLGKNGDLCFKCWFQTIIFKLLAARWFAFLKFDSTTLNNFIEDETFRRVLKNVIKGMAIFGVRMPYVTGAPLSVVWNYTKKCNLKCSHCFSDSTFNKKSENELTTEEAKQVVDILDDNDVVTVNFCGGEPLMREDIFEIMKYTKEKGIYPSISTNATLITKNTCQKLYDCGVHSISVSVDSISSKNHDQLRNVPEAFDNAVNGIKNIVGFGKFEEIIINSTLTDFNYNEFPEIYEYIKKLGATRYYISRILPTGRGKNYLNHDVNKEIKKKVMNFMAEKFIQNVRESNNLTVLGRGMPYFSRACYNISNGKHFPVCEILTGNEPKYQYLFDNETANIINRLSPFFSGCATGLFYCGLDCDGNVIPCAPAGEIKLGNILKKDFSKIWINSPILNRIRNRSKITGKCAKCVGKKFCGGCRLTAYSLTGDWLASDLSCPY